MGLVIDVLMSMNDKFGLGTFDIGAKSFESHMNAVIFVMNATWRVVGNEDVYGREVDQHPLNLFLPIKERTMRLVFPRSIESAKANSTAFDHLEVQVLDRRRKLGEIVMIAFYSEYLLAVEVLCGTKDDVITKIAAGKQDIGLAFVSAPPQVVYVR